MATTDIAILPVWTDNYSYLLDCGAGVACAVDPADAAAVSGASRRLGLRVSHIALTHHHGDHTAGCAELVREFDCAVVGPGDTDAACVTHPLGQNDRIQIGETPIQAIATPGHTSSHLSYYLPSRTAVFTGDALFVCGCGRVMGGDYDRMWQSLLTLRALPEETRVFCGHNYTVENIEFAQHLEPSHPELGQSLESARAADRRGDPTVPSTLTDERRMNPFLRCDDPALQQAVGMAGHTAEAVFRAIRRRKDAW